MEILKVENICKSFDDTQVLKGINFDLNEGEVLSIIGSSGSGKTTLLRCLNFLETPDCGKITVKDEILFDSDSKKKKKESEALTRKNRLHFGLVFQSFNLFPQYNVLDNVVLALNLLDKAKVKAEKKALLKQFFNVLFKRNKTDSTTIAEVTSKIKACDCEYRQIKQKNTETAIKMIDRVGLSSKLKAYPCELSGGQCQRVAIARALALQPNILCFDEPTSALDPELTGEVLKVIKELKQTTNCTMIIVTHEMDFAKNVSDKVIYMSNGIVEEMGTPKQVFDHPKSEKTKAFLSNSLSNQFEAQDTIENK